VLDFVEFPEMEGEKELQASPNWTIDYVQHPVATDSRLFTQEIMGEFLPEQYPYRHQNASIGFARQLEVDPSRLVLDAGEVFVNASLSDFIWGASPTRLNLSG
jgi:hypothetical protein